MKRLSTLAAGLLIGAAAFQFSSVASGQSDGWVTLVDSTKMGDWTEVGKANWAMKDGALVADKLRRQGSVLSRQQEFLQGLPDQGRVLDRRGSQQRHLHPLRQPGTRSTPRSATRSTSSTSGRTRPTAPARSSMSPRSIRCRRRPANGTPTRSRRRGRISSSCSTARRPSTCRTASTCRRPVRAAIRLRRGQVPQGADQAAVAPAVGVAA